MYINSYAPQNRNRVSFSSNVVNPDAQKASGKSDTVTFTGNPIGTAAEAGVAVTAGRFAWIKAMQSSIAKNITKIINPAMKFIFKPVKNLATKALSSPATFSAAENATQEVAKSISLKVAATTTFKAARATGRYGFAIIAAIGALTTLGMNLYNRNS